MGWSGDPRTCHRTGVARRGVPFAPVPPMTLADAWGQALALMLAWPPITGQEVAMYATFGTTAARMARAWVRL